MLASDIDVRCLFNYKQINLPRKQGYIFEGNLGSNDGPVWRTSLVNYVQMKKAYTYQGRCYMLVNENSDDEALSDRSYAVYEMAEQITIQKQISVNSQRTRMNESHTSLPASFNNLSHVVNPLQLSQSLPPKSRSVLMEQNEQEMQINPLKQKIRAMMSYLQEFETQLSVVEENLSQVQNSIPEQMSPVNSHSHVELSDTNLDDDSLSSTAILSESTVLLNKHHTYTQLKPSLHNNTDIDVVSPARTITLEQSTVSHTENKNNRLHISPSLQDYDDEQPVNDNDTYTAEREELSTHDQLTTSIQSNREFGQTESINRSDNRNKKHENGKSKRGKTDKTLHSSNEYKGLRHKSSRREFPRDADPLSTIRSRHHTAKSMKMKICSPPTHSKTPRDQLSIVSSTHSQSSDERQTRTRRKPRNNPLERVTENCPDSLSARKGSKSLRDKPSSKIQMNETEEDFNRTRRTSHTHTSTDKCPLVECSTNHADGDVIGNTYTIRNENKKPENLNESRDESQAVEDKKEKITNKSFHQDIRQPTRHVSDSGWTDEDVQLLKEAIHKTDPSKYSDRRYWNEVRKLVPNRGVRECRSYFLSYLSNEELAVHSTQREKTKRGEKGAEKSERKRTENNKYENTSIVEEDNSDNKMREKEGRTTGRRNMAREDKSENARRLWRNQLENERVREDNYKNHTRAREDKSKYGMRLREDQSESRTRAREDRPENRMSSREGKSENRTRAREDKSENRIRLREDNSENRMRLREDKSENRMRLREDNSENRMRLREDKSENRMRAKEDKSDNRTRAREDKSGNRMKAREDKSKNQTSTREDVSEHRMSAKGHNFERRKGRMEKNSENSNIVVKRSKTKDRADSPTQQEKELDKSLLQLAHQVQEKTKSVGRSQMKTVQQPVKLSGKGTFKRKQQIADLYWKASADYSPDAFDNSHLDDTDVYKSRYAIPTFNVTPLPAKVMRAKKIIESDTEDGSPSSSLVRKSARISARRAGGSKWDITSHTSTSEVGPQREKDLGAEQITHLLENITATSKSGSDEEYYFSDFE